MTKFYVNKNKLSMRQFYILCLALFVMPICIDAQTSQIKEQRRSFGLNKLIRSEVSLLQPNDTLFSFKVSNIQVIDQRKSDFNALGAYDDWYKNDSIAWLFLHGSVESEFQDYLDKVLIKDAEGYSLTLRIVKFRFRQYMFSNGKRAHYKYEYQLEWTNDGKQYISVAKESVKIDNVEGPKTMLDPIKLSLWQLVSNVAAD